MKYLIQFTFALLLILQVGYAQDKSAVLNAFTASVSQALDGIEGNSNDYFEDNPNKANQTVVEIPSYYDQQLVVSSIDLLMSEYSDLSYGVRWTKAYSEDPAAIINFKDTDFYFILLYDAELSTVAISVNDKTEDLE